VGAGYFTWVLIVVILCFLVLLAWALSPLGDLDRRES
jgi:cbb3-type cytochrome oxidase subunit 3